MATATNVLDETGKLYEVQLIIHLLLEGHLKDHEFKLGREISSAGKFDDICIHNPGSGYTFIQCKHVHNENKQIRSNDLLGDSDNFGLGKYFMSSIEVAQIYDKVEDLVIFTTIGLDFSQLSLNGFNFEEIVGTDKLITIQGIEKNIPRLYKITKFPQSSIGTYFSDFIKSEAKGIAFEIHNHFKHRKFLDITTTKFLRRYHTCLCKEVFKREENLKSVCLRFRPDFVSGTNLSQSVALIRSELDVYGGFVYNFRNKYLKAGKDFGVGKTWNFPSSQISPDKIDYFLSHFVLAVNQPNRSEFEEKLKEKLRNILKVQSVDFIYNSLLKKVENWALKDGQNEGWVSSKDGFSCHKEVEALLNALKLKALSQQWESELAKYGVTFETKIPQLEKFMNGNYNILLVIDSNGDSTNLLPMLRLYDYVISNDSLGESVLFLSIDQIKQSEVAQEVSTSATIRLIILQYTGDSDISDIIFPLSKKVKLILISNCDPPLGNGINGLMKITLSVKMSDFANKTRKKLLKTFIEFQGVRKRLDEIVTLDDNGTLGGKFLSDLVRNDNVQVGVSPLRVCEDPSCYTGRFQAINPSVLKNYKDALGKSTILITGKLTKEMKENISLGFCLEENGNNETFENLCRKTPLQTIHWFSTNGSGELVWNKVYDSKFLIDAVLSFQISLKNLKKLIHQTNCEIIISKELKKALNFTENLLRNVKTEPPKNILGKGYSYNFAESGNTMCECEILGSDLGASRTLGCSNFNKIWAETVVVIEDEPGMGKSTALSQIVEPLLGCQWVIRINLKSCGKELTKLIGFPLDFCQVSKFLWVSSKARVDDFGYPLFKRDFIGGKDSLLPVLILLDGFDELPGKNIEEQEHLQDLIADIIFFCEKACPTTKTWITSRNKYKLPEKLISKGCKNLLFVTKFVPVSEEKQLEFLWNFWQSRVKFLLTRDFNETFGLKATDEKSLFHKFATYILSRANSTLGSEMKQFMGIPLQLRLLSETYLDKFLEFANSAGDEDHGANINLLSLYKGFIKNRFVIFIKEKTNLASKLSPGLEEMLTEAMHMNLCSLGFALTFQQEQQESLLKGKFPLVENSKVVKEFLLLGLCQPKEGEFGVEFIHKTFSEYYAAAFLFSKIHRKKVRRIIGEHLFLKEMTVVRKFLDHLLSVKLPLHQKSLSKIEPCFFTDLEFLLETDELGRTFSHICAQEEEGVWFMEFLVGLMSQGLDPYFLNSSIFQNSENRVLRKDCFGRSCLHYAARFGNDVLLKYVLDIVVSDHLNLEDHLVRAPLHCGTEIGDYIFLQKSDVEYCQVSPVNQRDNFGKSALSYAVEFENWRVACIIILYGGNVSHIQNTKLKPLLQYAVDETHSRYSEQLHHLRPVVAILLTKMRDPVLDIYSSNPSILNYYYPRLLSHFLSFGHTAIVDSILGVIKNLKVTKQILEFGDNNSTFYERLLGCTAKFNDKENLMFLKYFLERCSPLYGADFNVKDRKNLLAIYLGTHGHVLTLEYFITYLGGLGQLSVTTIVSTAWQAVKAGCFKMVDYLLNTGVQLQTLEVNERTLLHHLAEDGELRAITYLIEKKGFDINFGRTATALDFAVEGRQKHIIEYLLPKGAKCLRSWNQGSANLTAAESFPIYSEFYNVEFNWMEGKTNIKPITVPRDAQSKIAKAFIHAKLGKLSELFSILKTNFDLILPSFTRNKMNILHHAFGNEMKIVSYSLRNGASYKSIIKNVNPEIDSLLNFIDEWFQCGKSPDYGTSYNYYWEPHFTENMKYSFTEIRENQELKDILVKTRDDNGNSLLHNPTLSLPRFKFLVEIGANVDEVNREGVHPIQALISMMESDVYSDVRIYEDTTYQYREMLSVMTMAFHKLKLVRILVENGARIDVLDKDRNTLLHLAVIGNCFPVVKYLVGKGVKISLLNGKGQKASDIAESLGLNGISKYLRSADKGDV